jgi:hypothetical protein
MVDQINNGEEGYSVREKLNTVIDRTNTLNGIENQVETNKQNIAKNTTEIDELWEHVDDVEDTIQDLDVSVLDDRIDKEIQDRIDGDQDLQDQIDALDADKDGSIDWDEVQGKPDTYPPGAHNHVIGDVDGLQTALDNKAAVNHNHDGIYQPAGDYVSEAPNDGKQYVRESKSWAEVDIPEPDTSNTLEGEWEYNPNGPNSGQFTTRNAEWIIATSVTLHRFDTTGYEHNFALMNEGDIIFIQAPAGGAEYSVVSKDVRANDCVFTVNAISSYGTFPSAGDAARVNFIPQASSGSSVHIGPNPPDPALEGQQWMEVPADGEATMWIYDGANWLQQPGGKDGADGADGVDGLWTDNGGSISYTGTVTVTGDLLAAKSGAGADALAVGSNAGRDSQGVYAVAFGPYSGQTNQSTKAASFGWESAVTGQGESATAVGPQSGRTDQGAYGVAVGYKAAYEGQASYATAVGRSAAQTNQGEYAVSVGYNAGQTTQGAGAIAIGGSAGWTGQGASSIAIGPSAGETRQGADAIAIGRSAGSDDQAANSIIISATGQSSNLSYAGVSIEVPGAYLNYNGSDEWHFEGGNVTGGGLRFDSIVQDGSPVIDAKGLITALTTLRNATMDETQDIRESLRSAIDELVAGFEQEIAAMPAGGPQ